MASRRLESAAALTAMLALPALVLLAAVAVRLLQPPAYEPARTVTAIFNWLVSLHAGPLVLVVGTVLALGFSLFAIWQRLALDESLRQDSALFLTISGRLLRRPAFIVGILSALGSLAVLAFVAGHAFTG